MKPPNQKTSTSTLSPSCLQASRVTYSSSDFDKIYKLCVGSKQMRVVRQQKPLTPAKDKLELEHVEFWGPHNPALVSGSIYVSILMCEKTRKTWVLYFCLKDKFVDAFQIWLSRVENKLKCTLKTLCADGGGEFISIKLRVFGKKRGIVLKYAALYMRKENGLAERG